MALTSSEIREMYYEGRGNSCRILNSSKNIIRSLMSRNLQNMVDAGILTEEMSVAEAIRELKNYEEESR